MCGIVGAIAERQVSAILVEGLKRLEYRGYDSAGVAIYTDAGQLQRCRRTGKVVELEQALQAEPLVGRLGIAHTRWATHGAPRRRIPPQSPSRRSTPGTPPLPASGPFPPRRPDCRPSP